MEIGGDVLALLDKARIFSCELNKDKTTLIVTDSCDVYFEIELSKAQVRAWANALLQLAEQMPEQ